MQGNYLQSYEIVYFIIQCSVILFRFKVLQRGSAKMHLVTNFHSSYEMPRFYRRWFVCWQIATRQLTRVATAIPPPNSRTPVYSDTTTASNTEERLYVNSSLLRCVIRGFSRGVNYNLALLRCDAASIGKHPYIRQTAVPATLGSNMARYLGLLQTEDKRNKIVRNVGKYLTIDKT
jgi:hypothetical protein